MKENIKYIDANFKMMPKISTINAIPSYLNKLKKKYIFLDIFLNISRNIPHPYILL